MKGRIAGLVALGALVALVGVAFYSSRDASGPAPPEGGSSAAATSPMSSPGTVSGMTEMPSVTESLPAVTKKGSLITAVAEDVALSPPARLLAERLQCVCGCKDILADCTCKETPGSRDMKKYLQQLVDEGRTPSEVETAMVARYGRAALP